jgi:hypothetical protein
VSPDLAPGFAVAGNFGSMLDYDDDWAGRYRVQDADLLGVSVMPSIAYRVNDQLSLGAGINGMFDQRVAINNAVPSLGDGRLEIDDDTWWGWAAMSACCTSRSRARDSGSRTHRRSTSIQAGMRNSPGSVRS